MVEIILLFSSKGIESQHLNRVHACIWYSHKSIIEVKKYVYQLCDLTSFDRKTGDIRHVRYWSKAIASNVIIFFTLKIALNYIG